MSTAYNKSISDEYSFYFEKISDFVKPFRQYSLKTHKIVIKNEPVLKPWENGIAGVPLSWNKEDNLVSVDQTDSHTLIVGPTGSKKTRLVIMPIVRILGSASESMIISDPKGEVYNRTAGYLQKQNYNIYVLNLRAPMYGNCWNPLSIPYDFFCKGEIDKSYEFVNDIAQNLVKSERAQSDPFWDNSAGSFFFGLVILLFKYCKDQGKGVECVHIGNVIRLRNALFPGQGSINTQIWNYAKTDLIISSSLIGTVETAKDTRAGILSVFDQKMRTFSIQPNLLDMLSVNDIDFNTIGTAPTAIYLVVPDEKTGYHGLVSLFIKQSYEYIIYTAQIDILKDGLTVGKLKNRVNYVLDEFSSLPTIHDFPAMITASRSRNIRFDLVIQSKHQLLQRYKDETETILTNCNNWIFFTSRELEFLEEISSLCGKTFSNNNPKPLLPISMLQRLDKESGEVLILSGRTKPCITMLPDIDKYDNNEYESVLISHRIVNKIVNLDFEVLSMQDIITRQGLFNKEKNFINLDEMISQIDKKIAELEEMEHQDHKDNDSFNTGNKNERG